MQPLLLSFLTLIALPAGLSAARKPNIVFILADDLGWADTTLNGHTKLYQTPSLERLAKRGMTFNRAYSASPLCSPTRSAILTGLSPARTGITTPNCHLPQVILTATPGKAPPNTKATTPESVSRLKTTYPTLAKSLKAAGYATGHFGKWHLGPKPYSPLEHAFDVDLPHCPAPAPPAASSPRGSSKTSTTTPPSRTSTSKTAWPRKPPLSRKEGLSLPAATGQKFDGVSILPALKGGELKRESLFTYFPHAPGVPDWLPASVSVTQKDWKLIRLFYGGEDGAHRWKLYNLSKDIGEKTDLADKEPEQVEAMDALITTFLTRTEAVTPVRNPSFNPKTYKIEDEGIQKPNPAGKKPKKTKK